MSLLTPENSLELKKRLLSFAWRLGGLVAAQSLDLAGQLFQLFDLPLWAVGLVGLAIGEATKAVSNYNKRSS